MNDILLSRASLRPSTHRCGGGADPANAPSPSCVLLDVSACVADRRNSTTATCRFRGDKELQVTFFLARPPRVSHFCVYCSGLSPGDYAVEPKVLATEAGLVLLRVAVSARYELWCPDVHHYFVYSADGGGGGCGGRPSLEQLPHPSPLEFRDEQVRLLAHDDAGGGYTVAALLDDSSGRDQYGVCILLSSDKAWTVTAVDLPAQEQRQRSGDGFRHVTSKVIAVGGERGTMAFVDLWRGILRYDVLGGGDPLLRYTLLPEIYPGWRREYSVGPLYTRDIAVVEDRIKYVEMPRNVSKAATWSMPATASCQEEGSWRHDCDIEVSMIRDDEKLQHSELLRMLSCDGGKPQPAMESLSTGHPTQLAG